MTTNDPEQSRPTPEFGRSHIQEIPAEASPTRRLLLLSGPALLIGIGSALGLVVLDLVARALENLLWDELPALGGFDDYAPWWILVVLTLAGFATGLIVRFAPGHAGPDPATESFFPLPFRSSRSPASHSQPSSRSPLA
ncbi:hypothetical protein [Microbacterium sp. NPDC076911]|uniref:hypothetical protein n=1 Tax=Microbacterium sp. NPDC076911 TaxID=3154958 RepID=UPI003423C0BC